MPSLLPPEHKVYTVLDLKDTFSICLSKLIQPIFTFKCADRDLEMSGKLTLTRLPEGFKISPTACDEAINKDLSFFHSKYPEVTLLQYVEDLLLTAKDEEDCLRACRGLLEIHPGRL